MIRLAMGGMFALMLALVFVAGSTAGASTHGNHSAYQDTRPELADLDNGTTDNLSDSGVEGYYKDYVVTPTINTAEQIAVASYDYGYHNPQKARFLGHGVQVTIYGLILYYVYKGYKLTKGVFKQ